MYHLNEIQIIDYVSGRLNNAAIREHLHSCMECRQKKRNYARLWQLLGKWKIHHISRGIDARPSRD